ncbi:MAG: hypothetical protein J6K39_01285 [Clostridia bacterium]|nr:hypothetical protein [Clostridia bacterium]
MFLGDKGRPQKYHHIRLNYDIIIDDEKFSLQKMTQNLGFYSISFDKKIKNTQIIYYDTDKKLLTGAGLILRKKITAERTYFSLVRISSLSNIENREKKSFLGECEPQDQPSDFPVQIADEINKIFNNLFTINIVDIVKHCTPYIKVDIAGNAYKIRSGTGYEAEMSFETMTVRDLRTKRKAKVRNFSLEMEEDPDYKNERQQILDVIDRHCKELFLINRNRFEIAETAVRMPEIKVDEDGKQQKEKKKSKKELKAMFENASEEKQS